MENNKDSAGADNVHLLVVEDSELDYELLMAIVKRDMAPQGLGVRGQRVEDEAGMREAFARGRVDAVITDHNLPRFDSFAALKVAKGIDDDLPVIVLSGEMADDLAVAALHAGADDFILKSRMFRLAPALKRSLDAAEARRDRRAQALAITANEMKLRELTQHLEHAKEEERRAIAREIHDDIGTTLTALKFELAQLARELGAKPTVAPRFNTIGELIAHAVTASHRIQYNLRPPVLDAGLVAALEWLVKGFTERTGTAASFESNRDEIVLAPERAAAVYRVAQEALANAAKYAQAGMVAVHLFVADEEITLEVADNGIGFDMQMLGATPGFGLRGMIERARGLGGWAEINAAPGRGTTIMFSVPPAASGAGADGAGPADSAGGPASIATRPLEWTDAG